MATHRRRYGDILRKQLKHLSYVSRGSYEPHTVPAGPSVGELGQGYNSRSLESALIPDSSVWRNHNNDEYSMFNSVSRSW